MNSQELNMTHSPGDIGVHEQGRRAVEREKEAGGGGEPGPWEPTFVTSTGVCMSLGTRERTGNRNNEGK